MTVKRGKQQFTKDEIIDILRRNVQLYRDEVDFVNYIVELSMYLVDHRAALESGEKVPPRMPLRTPSSITPSRAMPSPLPGAGSRTPPPSPGIVQESISVAPPSAAPPQAAPASPSSSVGSESAAKGAPQIDSSAAVEKAARKMIDTGDLEYAGGARPPSTHDEDSAIAEVRCRFCGAVITNKAVCPGCGARAR